MTWVATAIAGSAVLGYLGTQSASNAQSNAANQANALQQSNFNTIQANNAPWLNNGTSASNRMSDLMGLSGNSGAQGYGSLSQPFSMANFQSDPGYQFRLAQGQQALQRSAAAKGTLVGGGFMNKLNDYTQGLASQDYQQAYSNYNNDQNTLYSRLSGISGSGQASANQMAQAGTNNASTQGNNLMGAANASGAATMAGVNGVQGAINNGMNAWMTGNNGNMWNSMNAMNSTNAPNIGGMPDSSRSLSDMNGLQWTPYSPVPLIGG